MYSAPLLMPEKDKNEFLAEIERKGVVLEKERGLVLYDPARLQILRKKIAPDFGAVIERVKKARAAGKHVLYIPGSYDLVHRGHALYTEQVIHTYSRAASCRRSDLFVVALADDDELIRRVKNGKMREEPEPRPVETLVERLRDVATLDVDLAGPLPSPLVAPVYLPEPAPIDQGKLLFELEERFVPNEIEILSVMNLSDREYDEEYQKIDNDRQELRKSILSYAELVNAFGKGGMKEFLPHWTIQAWQLYLTLALSGGKGNSAEIKAHFTPGEITRVVSIHDSSYLRQIIFIMNVAGVSVTVVNDLRGGTTSEFLRAMIAEHGNNAWRKTREYKKKAIMERFGTPSH